MATHPLVEDVVLAQLPLHLVQVGRDEGHVVHVRERLLEVLCGGWTIGLGKLVSEYECTS